jgi:bacterioferritin-associated ferredoxin
LSHKCPICQKLGQEVSAITIESMLVKRYRLDYQKSYFICMNPTCNLAYYDEKGSNPIDVSELNTPIHFKEGAHPKFICYCSRVTEDEIVDVIQNKGCHTVEEVIETTQAYTVKKCVIHNPTGRNCLNSIRELINTYRKIK